MNQAPGTDRLRHLVERLRRRARTVRARARYRLGVPVAAPADVRFNEQFRHPVDLGRSEPAATRYRDVFQQSIEPELAEADRLAAHRVTLLGHTFDHGERLEWSRDPVSGREWSRKFSADIPYRGGERLGDIKLPWELNKHQYFFTLGKAAWLRGDVEPALEIVRQIDHWIDDNPYQRGIHWISALETGTRAISWILAYPFYASQCDARFRQRLASSMAQHMLFVEQHLSTGPFANTHLVGEAAVLAAGGLFLDCRHSARWLATGIEILEAEIKNQVTPDGVHAEQSVAYHRFFLDQYYLVSTLLAANQRSFSPATLKHMELMTSFLMHVVLPDGSVPDFGDADDARGVWLRADCPADYRGLLALGAVLFNRGDFKAAAGRVTEEVFWLLGLDGVARFEALKEQPAPEASVAYQDSGYYVMRGGWGRSDATLMFDCGPLGHGPAGHGHADALSFQLHARGYPFLVDSGTFSYNIDYSWRNVFRSTRAHNTIVVDGESQSVPRDRMAWDSAARSQLHHWASTPWFDLADGEHDGYRRLSDPVTHRRVVAFLKPDLWLIHDQVAGRAHHELEFLLHVRPDCRVDVGRDGQAVLTSPAGERLRVLVLDDEHQSRGLDVLQGDDPRRGAWFSSGYGRRFPSRALRLTRRFEGTCALVTCCSTSAQVRPAIARDHDSMRVHIDRGNGAHDAFFYRTGGAGTIDETDLHFDGALLFVRKKPGARPAIWSGRFRNLAVDGVLRVEGADEIHSLTFADGRCEMTVDPDQAGRVRVVAEPDVTVVINGQGQTASRMAPSMVTA